MEKQEQGIDLAGFSAFFTKNDNSIPGEQTSSIKDTAPIVEPEEMLRQINEGFEDPNKPATTLGSSKGKSKVDDTEIPADVLEKLDGSKKKSTVASTKSMGDDDDPIIEPPVEEEEEVEDTEAEDKSKSIETDAEDLGEYEEDIVDFFSEQFSKELGWEFEGEEKPKSVKDVVEMIKKVVEENSEPVYPDDKVKKLAEFVANGGKFEDFYESTVSGRLTLEDVDLTSESHQKAVLREHLRNTGYKDSAIDKKIQRWEDAGVLADEAEEALESVKEYREKTEEKLLADQRKYADDIKKQQQTFLRSVDDTVSKMKEINGIPVSDKELKETLDFIFRPEADGTTKFYKQTGMIITYKTNPTAMIAAAYFAKNGESISKKLERKVETKATKNLKEKLQNSKGNRGIDQGPVESGRSSSGLGLSSLGSQFLPRT